MVTVIQPSRINKESLINATLSYDKQWCYDFVCSYKNRLEEDTVMMDAGLS